MIKKTLLTTLIVLGCLLGAGELRAQKVKIKYYATIKVNELLLYGITWMSPTDILLKRNQTQKRTDFMVPFV